MKKKKRHRPPTKKTKPWVDEKLEQADRLLFPPRSKHRRSTRSIGKRK